jgi:hypothetical protein
VERPRRKGEGCQSRVEDSGWDIIPGGGGEKRSVVRRSRYSREGRVTVLLACLSVVIVVAVLCRSRPKGVVLLSSYDTRLPWSPWNAHHAATIQS